MSSAGPLPNAAHTTRAAGRQPPYKTAGLAVLLILAAIVALTYLQFRGTLMPKVHLTLLASRAGLVMDPGSPVTYNGAHIGRVARIEAVESDGSPAAKFTLDVDPDYLNLIPANVDAQITATTLFGNKYVAFSSPKDPSPQRITPETVIDITSATTEFNTLFETVVSVAQHVDPIKLNQTLSATAEALDGMGDRFGQSIIDGNQILGDLNPRMPEIRRDTELVAEIAEVYSDAAPDLFDGLDNATTTAHAFNDRRANLDRVLLASVGFGHTGAELLERGGPYFVRGTDDFLPTSALLDEYSPALFCTIRNYSDVARKFSAVVGGANGYAVNMLSQVFLGAGNPYVYPDNLPRVNARGGPEGRPGCWQPITRDLWPAPHLVMDTGASIAPYNHFGLGQPLLIDYVWGRQIGEHTINP